MTQSSHRIALDEMQERHDYEYEQVHNGSGRSEEMPSQLRQRHAEELALLRKRHGHQPKTLHPNNDSATQNETY